jgi:hypothetical protein
MMLDGHYQNAYVTRDLDAAIALFRVQYGFNAFRRHEVSYECTTRAGRGTATVKLALGWIGNLQYELIQPVSGLIDIYVDSPGAGHFLEYCWMTPERWQALGGAA